MNKKSIGILITFILLAIVAVSGCVDSTNNSQGTVNNSTPAQPAFQANILCCPNPDCVLHDPNKRFYSNAGHGDNGCRPITVVPITGVGSGGTGSCTYGYHYVCGVCSEQWDTDLNGATKT